MSAAADTVFLFDVDNTLLDNDRFQDDLREELKRAHGETRLRALLGRFSRSCAANWATPTISARWNA